MKRLLAIAFSLLTITGFGQAADTENEKPVKEPLFFIDSVRVDMGKVKELNPKEISSVSVYKQSDAIKLVGPEGRVGLVYIETKKEPQPTANRRKK